MTFHTVKKSDFSHGFGFYTLVLCFVIVMIWGFRKSFQVVTLKTNEYPNVNVVLMPCPDDNFV